MSKATYGEIQSAASSITKASEDYRGNVEGLYQVIDSLESSWKGSDNLSFVNTVNGYKEDLKSLGSMMDSYAGLLNNAVGILSETQQDVSNLAQRL